MRAKSGKATSVICFAALIYLLYSAPANAQAWPNGYSTRRTITINHSKVSNTDQTNFPVLISGTYADLASTSNGGSVTNTSGYDIVFASDPAGANPLAFEQDGYNGATGQIAYWVKIPVLSASVDTVIFMFYGNAAVTTDTSTKTAVWDSNFVGVWHLPNGAVLSANDSTSNGHNATALNGTSAAAGEVGGAAAFNGTTNTIAIDSSSDFNFTSSPYTIEFWMNPATLGSNNGGVPISRGQYQRFGWYVFIDNTNGNLYFATNTSGAQHALISTGAVGLSSWQHFVFVRDPSASAGGYIYKNGASRAISGSLSNAASDTTDGLSIGSLNGATNFANGTLDEVRISKIVRSADWVATEYNNESSPSTFFSTTAATQASSTAPVITSGVLSYSTGVSITLSGVNFGAGQGSSTLICNGATLVPTGWTGSSIAVPLPFGISNTSAAIVVTVAGITSNSFSVTAQAQALPSPWIDQDIGSVSVAGTGGFVGGVFTQTASGASFGNGSDAMNFVYQSLSGDGTIVARTLSQGTGASAVMIRETLASNSKDAYVSFANGTALFSARTTVGGLSGSGTTMGGSLPFWLMLSRSGNVFTGFASQDGVNWTQLGATQTISMAQSVYIGLASQSASSTLAKSKFDSVSLSSSSLQRPAISGVSATTGLPGTQVVISGSGFGASQGGSAVTLNGVGVVVNSWTDTSIAITIPGGATTGALMVVLSPTMNVSNFVRFAVESNPLPSPWLDLDVGGVVVLGSGAYSSGTFTVTGSGTSVGSGTADSMHLVYQPLSGDGSIIARVVSMQGGNNGQTMGVMIRESTSSGSTLMGATYSSGVVNNPHRLTTGGSGTAGNSLSLSLPCWVQVVRTGNSFSTWGSSNGLNWTQLGSSQTINMSSNAFAGLVVDSGNSNLETATLDSVSVVPGRTNPVAPAIANLSPNYGGYGASVTINGVNFGATQGTSTVSFNGTLATSIASWSATQIVAIVPNGAPTGQVTVTVASVPSLSNPSFTIYNPVISSITPPEAPVGATVTVYGSGFGTANAGFAPGTLTLNGTAVSSWLNWANGSISFTVPANATSGLLTVSNGGVTSAGIQFTVSPVSISSVSPTTGTTGITATISGSGFGPSQSNSVLAFNSFTATSITSWSDSQIVAIVPDQATTGPISLTIGGITSKGPTFTVDTIAIVTDSLGNQSTYTGNSFGGEWRNTDATGSGCSSCTVRGVIHNSYDSNGNLLATTNESSQTTTNSYDGNNNLLSTSRQLDQNTPVTNSYTYNGFGEVLTSTDPLGNITTNTYDANGNLLTVTTPAPDGNTAASVTHFAYDTKGELTQITDPLGHVTNISYNAVGLMATITDAQNNVTTYAYDAHGNRTSVKDANNQTTTFAYDAGDRLTTITYPDSTTSSFAYDSRGRRTSATDQNGKTTGYAYDDANRLTTVTDAASNVTTYVYDTENNLLSITDANGYATSFNYDAFGRVTQTAFPSSHTETYTYDAIGNLLTKTDRNGQTIQYVYDALSRLSHKGYPDSTGVDYVYDLVSKIKQVTDPTGTYGFAYDNMGRLIGTTTQYSFLSGTTFANTYAYDAASNRTGFTAPDGSTNTYSYDTLNRLTTLANSWAGSFGFTYDALSRRTQMTRPNGVNTNYSYDSLSRLLSVLHQAGGSTIDGATYTVDAGGNRTSKTDQLAGVQSNYTYDALYQLTQVTQGANTTESYSYDPVGNRLSSLGVSPYSYNNSNEQTATPSATYTYDYNGNTLSKTDVNGTSVYTWNFENELASATPPSTNGTVTYRYDPFGRRIYKNSSSGTAVYIYDSGAVIERTDAIGSITARFSHGQLIDEPLAAFQGTAITYFEADGLGSTTSLSNGVGTTAQTYAYDSFGKQTSSSGSLVNPFQYTAREFDPETNLYFYRSRYYDPSTGRFMSEDPARFLVGSDFYSYVANSPTNAIDPSGQNALTAPVSVLTDEPGLGPIGEACAANPVLCLGIIDASLAINDGRGLYKLGVAYGLWGNPSASDSQRQHEYELAKRFCDTPAPVGASPCATLSNQIEHAKRCIALYEAWDLKWQPNRHIDNRLRDWKNRLDQLIKDHQRKCTNKYQ